MDKFKAADSKIELEKLSSAIELLSRKWQPLILYLLCEEKELGFNQIKEKVGDISGKVLSESLKDLEEKNVIEKEIVSESPKRVKYRATQKGHDMKPVLEELLNWGEKYANQDEKKILVVDDEKKLADIYGQWLDPQHRVTTAYNGKQALERLENDMDLVLLDRMMPDTSGEQVLDKIRENIEDVLVVMVTAKDPELGVANLDIDDYLIKPISQEDLTTKVDEVLSRSEGNNLKKELAALTSKKEILNEKFSEENLESTESYLKLVDEINELKKNIKN